MKKLTVPEFKSKTQEEIDEMTASEMGTYFKSKNEYDTAVKHNEMVDEIETLRKEDAEKNEKAIKELEAKMTAIVKENERLAVAYKSMTEQPKVGKDRSMTPFKANIESRKEEFSAFKDGKVKTFKMEDVDMTTKAQMNPTDIADREQLGQFEPGVSAIPHKRIYHDQIFENRQASTEYIKYVEQANIVRDAKNVAACATSTHNTKVDFAIKDLQMKKIRDFVDICIDMIEDYSFVESEVRSLVDTSLRLKKDSDVLLGTGVGAIINGIDSYASTFSATSAGANYFGAVANATLIDLLVVAGAQISAFGEENFFSANIIELNPKDATLMGLLKDVDQNYIKVGTVNASVFRDMNGTLFINGMRVVENPNVPENEAYIYDSTKGVLYSRKGVTIEMSYENATNFQNELVTVKAYERGNLRVRNNDANAFMHIADINAAVVSITTT